MSSGSSGIRELQIARSIITLRWAGIPVIMLAAVVSKYALGMTFAIEPIYLICCALSILNVFFTIHFSVLSRQLTLTHGISGLKKLLLYLVSAFFADIKEHGIKRLSSLPKALLKIGYTLYLMLLEAVKDVPFNPFTLKNVMHSQIFCDLLIINLLTRFTGTTESPALILSVIPITIAAAVTGFGFGIFYSTITVLSWFLISLLIQNNFLTHIKFYPPSYGDLSDATGWIVSYGFVSLSALIISSYFANKLTSLFKERILFLTQKYTKLKSLAIFTQKISEQSAMAWLIMDIKGTIEYLKSDSNKILSSEMIGKNLILALPELESQGVSYLIQALLTTSNKRKLKGVELKNINKYAHIYDLTFVGFKNQKKQPKILVLFEDMTEVSHLRVYSKDLDKEINELKNEYEKKILQFAELKTSHQENLKTSDERFRDIEELNKKLSEFKTQISEQDTIIKNQMGTIASLKSSKDELISEIEYKQMILDEITQITGLHSEMEKLINFLEEKTRSLFNIDNACLHIFKASDSNTRVNEILSTRKASPRLLDIPRRNPETLNSALNKGCPVVVNAQITPEKSATLAINNGPSQRLIAYIPVRHDKKVIGMMMLEKYGHVENPDLIINMLVSYLKYSSAAIMSAIKVQSIKDKNTELNTRLKMFFVRIESIKSIIFSRPTEESGAFSAILKSFSEIIKLKDAIFVRVNYQNSSEILARLDNSKNLELSPPEERLVATLRLNPLHKITLNLDDESEKCIAYPLCHSSKLIGALFIYQELWTESIERPEDDVTDLCVSILRDQLALYILSEEKEVWQSFYKENLSL